MNGRIQELIEQASETSTSYFDGRGNITETYFDKEKFAELIIRECAKVVDEEIVGELDDYTMRKIEHCSRMIKKHFYGVKE